MLASLDSTAATYTDEFAGFSGLFRRQFFVNQSFRYEYEIRGLASFPERALRMKVDLSFDGMPVLHVDRVEFALDGRSVAVADPYFLWHRRGSAPSAGDLTPWERIESLDGTSLRALFATFEASRSNASLTVFDRLAEREDTPLAVTRLTWKCTTGPLALFGPTTRRELGAKFRSVLESDERPMARAATMLVAMRLPASVAWLQGGEHPATAIESERWPRNFVSLVDSPLRIAGAFPGDTNRFFFRGRTRDLELAISRAGTLPETAIAVAFHANATALPTSLSGSSAPPTADWSRTTTYEVASTPGPRFLARFDVVISDRIDRAALDLPENTPVLREAEK